jgi:23S rRNA (uracil1939-C5)-methyltransferase
MKKKTRQVNSSAPIISTTITGLSHDGRGITTLDDGKTTFVSGALAGEKITFKVTKQHSRYNEGEVVEVIEASPERITAKCAHFGVCGGCSMQHMNMSAQVDFKQKILLEQLKHFGRVEPEILLAPISANQWGYRRKARLGARYVRKKEKMLVGFREKATGILADMDSCLILHASVGLRLSEIRNLVASLSQVDQIPQIEVAVGDNATALIFRHMTDLPAEDLAKLIALGKEFQFEIYLQPNAPAPLQKLWPADQNNRLSYALPDYELEMQFHPLDFTQINGEVNPLMIQQALKLLDPQSTDTVLDLFCGLGNFTLPLARYAKHVIGIEGSQEMVSRGYENANHNNISNVEFHAANLALIPDTRPAWMKKKYDKILLDPPRTGAKEIIELFPHFSASRLVYVSCNPATLARDAGELVHQQGFKLKAVGVVNMFPHTSHIEAIALFEK